LHSDDRYEIQLARTFAEIDIFELQSINEDIEAKRSLGKIDPETMLCTFGEG
jgi:hypothetical protein